MVKINCLFNFDGFNHRLEVNASDDKNAITFEELRRNLREHPKLKSVDFFDSEKYIIEIFDKGFDDYLKLPRDATIPDFSKLRARLKPKANYTLAKKDNESLKRPLSMYSEINIEEEHAQKILRGSPPPVTRARPHSSPPPAFRRSHAPSVETPRTENSNRSHASNAEMSRLENSNRSHTSHNSPVTPKPAIHSTPKTLVPTKTPTTAPRATAALRTPATSNTQTLPKLPRDTGASNAALNASKSSGDNGNEDNLSDSAKLILAKAVAKYNDEFTDIMMFDDIWGTENVWSFVFREISGQGVKDIKNVPQTRKLFKSLVDKYISLLQNPSISENEAIESWPLFEIFHHKMNLKPFYGRIQILKDAFATRKPTKNNDSKLGKPEIASQIKPSSPSLAPAPAPPTVISEPILAPKPQRFTPKSSEDIIILTGSEDNDKPDILMDEQDDEPEIEEISSVNNLPSPRQTNVPSPCVTAANSLNITSDDFRLLLAVEDHNKEFYDETVPEYSIWREVTDQINLYKPFDPSLIMKYKTRFYELLEEFIRIQNSSIPVAEKAQWKLYSSFINIDTAPFESKLN